MDTSLEKRELIVRGYMDHMRVIGFRPSTVDHYRDDVKEFMEYVKQEERILDLRDVDRQMVLRYQVYLHTTRQRKLSLRSQIGKLVALRNFFKFLEKRELILFDPTSQIQMPKEPEKLPRGTFSEKEMKKLLSVVDIDRPLGLRDKAMLELLYSTAVRSGELVNLDVYDVDFENKMLKVREGKGGKDRVLPAGEIATGYIREYLDQGRNKFLKDPEERALFLSWRGRRLNAGADVPRIVQQYARKAGIRRYVCAHMIRHSVATHMLRRRAPIRYIQELLGHKDINTTTIYTQVEIGDLKRVHERTHPRERA